MKRLQCGDPWRGRSKISFKVTFWILKEQVLFEYLEFLHFPTCKCCWKVPMTVPSVFTRESSLTVVTSNGELEFHIWHVTSCAGLCDTVVPGVLDQWPLTKPAAQEHFSRTYLLTVLHHRCVQGVAIYQPVNVQITGTWETKLDGPIMVHKQWWSGSINRFLFPVGEQWWVEVLSRLCSFYSLDDLLNKASKFTIGSLFTNSVSSSGRKINRQWSNENII